MKVHIITPAKLSKALILAATTCYSFCHAEAEPSLFTSVDEKIIRMAEDVLGSDAHSYFTQDSEKRQMASLSLLDSFHTGYKYLAVYHSPVKIGKHFRFDVHLAGSNDLKTFAHVRELLHNADMPRIQRVWDETRKVQVIAVVHEQWKGPGPESNVPSHNGIKLYRDEKALLEAKPFADITLPHESFIKNSIEGTPNLYRPRITVGKDGDISLDTELLYHFYSAKAGRDQQAYGKLTGMNGGKYEKWEARPWPELNKRMDEEGVKGNVGQRTVQYDGTSNNPSMFLEANIGGFTIRHGQTEWADWRVFYLKFPSEDVYGNCRPSIRVLNPKTHKGSVSFGNPSMTILRSPWRDGLIMVFNYFLFAEGCKDPSEQQSLVFYHRIKETDFDEDGLNDKWEYKHSLGLSFFNKSNTQADPDKDGISNATEAGKGSNPFSAK